MERAKQKLNQDIAKFMNIFIMNTQSFTRYKRSSMFWIEKRNEFPLLYKLNLILSSIPASSAFIERFFSVTGLYSNKRNRNMKCQTLIRRSLLKANRKYIPQLTI